LFHFQQQFQQPPHHGDTSKMTQQQQQQNSAILSNLQMNYEFNANGLELAGFCSPSGRCFFFITLLIYR
jgi:hypothetical protein